jgi:hypothetical protein
VRAIREAMPTKLALNVVFGLPGMSAHWLERNRSNSNGIIERDVAHDLAEHGTELKAHSCRSDDQGGFNLLAE